MEAHNPHDPSTPKSVGCNSPNPRDWRLWNDDSNCKDGRKGSHARNVSYSVVCRCDTPLWS